MLRRAVKMRADSAAQADQVGRGEIAGKERQEIAWIEAYLPQQMDEAQIEAKLRELVAEHGVSSKKDIGSVMKAWMGRYQAVADGKLVNQILGRLLG